MNVVAGTVAAAAAVWMVVSVIAARSAKDEDGRDVAQFASVVAAGVFVTALALGTESVRWIEAIAMFAIAALSAPFVGSDFDGEAS